MIRDERIGDGTGVGGRGGVSSGTLVGVRAVEPGLVLMIVTDPGTALSSFGKVRLDDVVNGPWIGRTASRPSGRDARAFLASRRTPPSRSDTAARRSASSVAGSRAPSLAIDAAACSRTASLRSNMRESRRASTTSGWQVHLTRARSFAASSRTRGLGLDLSRSIVVSIAQNRTPHVSQTGDPIDASGMSGDEWGNCIKRIREVIIAGVIMFPFPIRLSARSFGGM